MSSKKWQIARRTMLRGMGAAIALPLLDAMVPSRAYAAKKAAKAPVRMACMYFPNGAWMDTWIPKATGADYELPYALGRSLTQYDDCVIKSCVKALKDSDYKPSALITQIVLSYPFRHRYSGGHEEKTAKSAS
ncbi:MAG: DUF1585 domain-containing protein [Candidatus Hydrogenedentes bacterium]|nr:DUF1585 domain-containing protein [Candidatus Hydrogenedentota bacterium]